MHSPVQMRYAADAAHGGRPAQAARLSLPDGSGRRQNMAGGQGGNCLKSPKGRSGRNVHIVFPGMDYI